MLVSATQLNAVGRRSTKERFTETITNAGRGPVTVHLAGRTLSPYSTVAARKLHLTRANHSTDKVRFHVAGGQARLSVSVAIQGIANIYLIAPDGDLAEYNFPQGQGNFANAQVADPAKGTWTAVITGFPQSPRLTTRFRAQTATWRSFGTLSARSLRLAQGASRTVSLTASTPPVPGDRSGAIVLWRSGRMPKFSRRSTIPVTLRSVASTSTTFTGTLTGGNGRDENEGQVAYYEINVRPGTPALNASISLSTRFDQMLTELVSPTGLVESAANNTLLFPAPPGRPPKQLGQPGTELQVTRPAAGNWTLIVDFVNPVTGTKVATPFTVSIDDHVQAATQTCLPTSVHTKLVAGKPVTAHLTITNSSALSQQYFVDARRNSRVWLTLAPLAPAKLRLPDLNGDVPSFLVPSGTTRVSAKVTAPAKQFFDLSWAFGDPDVISSTGKTSTATFAAPLVPNGIWVATPNRVGPDGSKPTKPVRAHVTMRALTAPFDPTITAPTGDLWLRSTNKKAALHPRLAKPGQKITIGVRIDPKGAPGTVVSGTIYISSVSFNPGSLAYNFIFGESEDLLPTGSNVIAFHYAYTIAAP